MLTLSQFKRYENEMMEKERDKRAENGVKSFFAGYAIKLPFFWVGVPVALAFGDFF